ncbi:MAG: hypothetical protein NC338_06790 [Firmicutes bacterium]|nr:hypothetical protein [Bacillota bacterium]MCM1401664.1 hypothetical protein [Bacteroides sp.]MCM1477559.1 hypothetical protein [Bacteroides sp.]
MKRFFTLATAAMMMLTAFQPVTMAQSRRPGQSTVTPAKRPGSSNVRPGTKPGHQNGPVVKPTKPTRPSKPAPAVRPGHTASRPAIVKPPVRPNRMPALRPVPVRPSNWRTSTLRLNSTILGITLGTTLARSLDQLYNSYYSIDGYNSNEVYLRNVRESGYNWTDATLVYSNGVLTQSTFYESTIGYDTSRYYGIYNYLRSLYGNPTQRNTDGRSMTSTWWGANGNYVTLEYTLLKSTGGYRYFTVLTYGN